jgi:hypothetical protein
VRNSVPKLRTGLCDLAVSRHRLPPL